MNYFQIGPIFFQVFPTIPGTQFFHTAPLTELDPPYRYGKAYIFRISKLKSFFLGFCFRKHPDEETALLSGVQGYKEEILDDKGELKERYRTAALETVATSARDFDDEWEIVDSLELLKGND